MKLTKMHGLGNDFILVDNLVEKIKKYEYSSLAKDICDRNFGIGADGLILVEKSKNKSADYFMRIINSDGSEAEMCGNGIRCFAKYVSDNNFKGLKVKFSVDTLAGIKHPKIVKYEGNVAEVKVDMGEPILDAEKIPTTLGKKGEKVINFYYPGTDNDPRHKKGIYLTTVSMGNPHAVLFYDDFNQDGLDKLVETHGKFIESNILAFPKKTNVEFVSVLNPYEAIMRVYERGCGPTLACGTGACASVVAGVLNDKLIADEDITIHLKGGDLKINWAKDGHVYMTGKAKTVFTTEDYRG